MKYCTECGAAMNDDDLFCPKCGAKVDETALETTSPSPKEAAKPNAKIKGARVPLEEQKVKEFLPLPLALIACSIAIWIVDAIASLTGIPKIMPLIIFILLSGLLGGMSLARAIKTLRKQNYFNSALSFVLFALLAVCLIVDFTFLLGA